MNFEKIKKEFFELDPSLKNEEETVLKLIKKLYNSKPNVEINKTFYLSFRDEILKLSKVKKETSSFKNFLKDLFYFGAGAVFSAFVIIPLFFFVSNQTKPQLERSNLKIQKMAVQTESFVGSDFTEEMEMDESVSVKNDSISSFAVGERVSSEMEVFDPSSFFEKVISIDLKKINFSLDGMSLLEKSGGYSFHFSEGKISILKNNIDYPKGQERLSNEELKKSISRFFDRFYISSPNADSFTFSHDYGQVAFFESDPVTVELNIFTGNVQSVSGFSY